MNESWNQGQIPCTVEDFSDLYMYDEMWKLFSRDEQILKFFFFFLNAPPSSAGQ